ncbi:MAG: DNA repair exonuclease [Myxococcota bacterium]
MYRFVHAADLHLDAPFRGLARRDPEIAQQLRDASLHALDALVESAIERNCHFVLMSGDIYDGLERGVRAQVRLRNAAARLAEHGIRLFLLHGNHDPVHEGYVAVDQWPETTVVFGAGAPEVHAFACDGGRVTVTGQSYPSRKVTQSLAAGYPAPEGEGLHVAMLHTELDEHGLDHPYSPCVLSDLVATGFHYWALGHIHDQKVLHAHPPVVAYSGNLQGRHFAECGSRGALFVSGAPHELQTEPLALAPVVFERVLLDATDVGAVDDVVKALTQRIPSTPDALQLLRAEIQGRSTHYRALGSLSRDEWLRILQDAAPPAVRWVDVRLDVQPMIDLEALSDAPTLAGALVRRARQDLDLLALLDEVPALRGLAERLNDEAQRHLLTRALARAVDAVTVEGA